MTISDVRFGVELITKKGRIYKFDDTRCAVNFINNGVVPTGQIKNIYLSNYAGDHQLIEANTAFLLKAEGLRSPMGGNIAAFNNNDSLAVIQKRFGGNTLTWNQLIKP